MTQNFMTHFRRREQPELVHMERTTFLVIWLPLLTIVLLAIPRWGPSR